MTNNSNQRKTEILQQKAYKYYCMGLNSKEIAKLLDISFRTVQNYMFANKWKQNKKDSSLKYEISKMYEIGLSYNEIAKKLNISRSTVYNNLKKTRTFKEKK